MQCLVVLYGVFRGHYGGQLLQAARFGGSKISLVSNKKEIE